MVVRAGSVVAGGGWLRLGVRAQCLGRGGHAAGPAQRSTQPDRTFIAAEEFEGCSVLQAMVCGALGKASF